MPITLSGTRITALASAGDSKGISALTPFTLNDVYLKSVSEGWNPPVLKQKMCYSIPYSLYIDGTTNFAIGTSLTPNKQETLVFCSTTQTDAFCFYANSYNLKIGETQSNNLYGANFIADSSVMAAGKKYLRFTGGNISNCIFYRFETINILGTIGRDISINNIIIYNITQNLQNNTYTNMDNVQSIGGTYGISISGSLKYNNNIQLIDNTRGILEGNTAPITHTFNNTKVVNSISSDTYVRLGYGTAGAIKNLFLVDCTIDPSKSEFYISGTTATSGSQIFQSSFTVSITDPLGNSIMDASIRLYDSSLNLLFSDTSMNSYPITFFRKDASASGGVFTSQTQKSFEPFKAIINKVGYKQEEINKITITIGQPTILRPTMTMNEDSLDEIISIY